MPARPILPNRAALPARPILASRPILPAMAGGRRGGVIQGAFLGGQPRLLTMAVRPGAGPIQRSATPPASNATPMPAGFEGFRPVRPPQRMPEAIQRKMETLFKTSFADVRIHVGPQAGSIGAQAFTQGSDIYFAHGQYNPTTPQGQRLLGQQLAHVVQQLSGRARNPFNVGMAVVTDPLLKSEAEMMGVRAAMPQPAQPKLAGSRASQTPGQPQVPSLILPNRTGAQASTNGQPATPGAIRPGSSGPILPRRPDSATSIPTPTRPKSATSATGAILPSRPSTAFRPTAPILPDRAVGKPTAAQPMMALGAAVAMGRHVVNTVGRWMFGS